MHHKPLQSQHLLQTIPLLGHLMVLLTPDGVVDIVDTVVIVVYTLPIPLPHLPLDRYGRV